MIYNVTFGFAGLSTGWSETHAVSNVSENPQDLIADAIQVAQKRVTFLGREFSIVALRVSKYSNDGATVRTKGRFPLKQTFKNPVQLKEQAAEPAVVALNITGVTNPQLAPPAFVANTNRTYCGAPPDDAVSNGGIVDPSKVGLDANFNQWKTLLTTKRYGWLAQKLIVDLEIDSISQEANGTVRLVTKTAIVPPTEPLVLGTVYPCYVRGVNQRRSPLNGQLQLRYVAVNTWTTTAVIGLGLAQAGGNVKVYAPISPWVGYADLILNGEVAKHQRGLPFGFTRGRAPNRVRG